MSIPSSEGLASGTAYSEKMGASWPPEKDEGELESYLAKALAIYVLTYSPQRIILGGVMNQKAALSFNSESV